MVKSNVMAGTVIERALKRAQMLDIGEYKIHSSELLTLLHEGVLEVARKHFEMDKENYYEPRPMLMESNGKFAATGTTYTASTKRLAADMTPIATSADIGKVVTFFDAAQTPNKFFAGMITDVDTAASPTEYEVTLFFPSPDLVNIVNVTVGAWANGGLIIPITGENQIFSAENMVLFDISNSNTVEFVDYNEFEFRMSLSQYREGDSMWARYRRSAIDIAVGTGLTVIGTMRLSAYFQPPKAGDFDSLVSIDDVRLGEVEERMVQRLLSIKSGTPLPALDTTQAELAMIPLQDKDTKQQIEAVR
jgi:hypothetical protein